MSLEVVLPIPLFVWVFAVRYAAFVYFSRNRFIMMNAPLVTVKVILSGEPIILARTTRVVTGELSVVSSHVLRHLGLCIENFGTLLAS